MMALAVEREFPVGLPDACSALDKLTGSSWEIASVEPYQPQRPDQPLEAVRLNVNGRPSPRFVLAVTGEDAASFGDRVKNASGLDLPLDAVLAETANIVISAVLNRMAERCGETLIVTAPQGVSGRRGEVYGALLRPKGQALLARLVSPGPRPATLELIAAWDA